MFILVHSARVWRAEVLTLQSKALGPSKLTNLGFSPQSPCARPTSALAPQEQPEAGGAEAREKARIRREKGPENGGS